MKEIALWSAKKRVSRMEDRSLALPSFGIIGFQALLSKTVILHSHMDVA